MRSSQDSIRNFLNLQGFTLLQSSTLILYLSHHSSLKNERYILKSMRQINSKLTENNHLGVTETFSMDMPMNQVTNKIVLNATIYFIRY